MVSVQLRNEILFKAPTRMLAIPAAHYIPPPLVNVSDVPYRWPLFRCPSLADFGCPPGTRSSPGSLSGGIRHAAEAHSRRFQPRLPDESAGIRRHEAGPARSARLARGGAASVGLIPITIAGDRFACIIAGCGQGPSRSVVQPIFVRPRTGRVANRSPNGHRGSRASPPTTSQTTW